MEERLRNFCIPFSHTIEKALMHFPELNYRMFAPQEILDAYSKCSLTADSIVAKRYSR